MKILQVTPRYPPHSGGVETHVQEISEHLVKRGHNVTVITADNCNNVQTRETRNGVTVERHYALAPGDAFHMAPGITAAVSQTDADVVHAHNYHSFPLFFATLGVTDERLIITPHYHGGSAGTFRNLLLSVYRPFGKLALHRAEEVIAVSEWESKQLWNDFNVEATEIPNGLTVSDFVNADPESRNRPYFFCIGRLEKYKGVQHAIRILPEFPEYDLVIAGAGPYRKELERITDEVDVDDRTVFLGYVHGDRLPALYAGAEVHLALSSFEAYGMTVAEALAAGTPCVVLAEKALGEWASTQGCVKSTSTSSSRLKAAIHAAKKQDVDLTNILSWGDVANRLENVYRSE